MSLIVVGISHKTAPVELREKLSFSLPHLERVLSSNRGQNDRGEIAVLSTCNRTEVYRYSEAEEGSDWGAQFLKAHYRRDDLDRHLYVRRGEEAVEHLFRVAAGLDSLVFGEHEILKQVKDAYLLSQKLGLTGKIFNVLFQRALYVGKLVRSHTAIGQGAISVGSVAVSLSEKIFGDLSKSAVLVFGAGEMAEVSARYLLSKKVKSLWVANRTLENARALADKFNAEPLTLEQGFVRMISADIVITSAASSEPILGKPFLSDLMLRRQNKSLFLIDIAVPRNVDPEAHKIDNLYLYNIDDLQAIAQENLKGRGGEIEKAGRIVKEKSGEFFGWIESLKSGEEKSLKHRADFARRPA